MKLTLKHYLESLPKNKLLVIIMDASFKMQHEVKTYLTMNEEFLNFKIRAISATGVVEV